MLPRVVAPAGLPEDVWIHGGKRVASDGFESGGDGRRASHGRSPDPGGKAAVGRGIDTRRIRVGAFHVRERFGPDVAARREHAVGGERGGEPATGIQRGLGAAVSRGQRSRGTVPAALPSRPERAATIGGPLATAIVRPRDGRGSFRTSFRGARREAVDEGRHFAPARRNHRSRRGRRRRRKPPALGAGSQAAGHRGTIVRSPSRRSCPRTPGHSRRVAGGALAHPANVGRRSDDGGQGGLSPTTTRIPSHWHLNADPCPARSSPNSIHPIA